MTWDLIIVGARLAGVTLAASASRAGCRVLLVDRSDLSGDLAQQATWSAEVNVPWQRLGLLRSAEATGAPRLTRAESRIDGVRVRFTYPREAELAFAMSVRRSVLDPALAQRVSTLPGVELRLGTSAIGLMRRGRRVVGALLQAGATVTEEHARVVVGADGRHSWLARAVRSPINQGQQSDRAFYFADFVAPNVERSCHIAGRHDLDLFMVMPEDGGLTTVGVAIPASDLDAFRAGLPTAFDERLYAIGDLRSLLRDASRTSRVRGSARVTMFQRRATGLGWALVGDAGYHLDPASSLGCTAAVVGANLLGSELLGSSGDLEGALSRYAARRDRALRPYWTASARLAKVSRVTRRDRSEAVALARLPAMRRQVMRARFGLLTRVEVSQLMRTLRGLARAT